MVPPVGFEPTHTLRSEHSRFTGILRTGALKVACGDSGIRTTDLSHVKRSSTISTQRISEMKSKSDSYTVLTIAPNLHFLVGGIRTLGATHFTVVHNSNQAPAFVWIETELNRHSQGRRVYSALGSPMPSRSDSVTSLIY